MAELDAARELIEKDLFNVVSLCCALGVQKLNPLNLNYIEGIHDLLLCSNGLGSAPKSVNPWFSRVILPTTPTGASTPLLPVV